MIIVESWNVSELVSSEIIWKRKEGIQIEKTEIAEVYHNLDYVIEHFNNSKADVICLQEFPAIIKDSSIADLVTEKTLFKYSTVFPTANSFLFSGGSVGTAVFSRIKMNGVKHCLFNNPNLSIMTTKGDFIYSFNKGIISCEFENKLNIITCHGIPFDVFKSDPLDYPDTFLPLVEIIRKNIDEAKGFVVAGDLNTDKFFELYPGFQGEISDIVRCPTTIPGYYGGKYYKKGVKKDCVFISNNIQCNNCEIHNTIFDHCVISCQLSC